MSPRKPVVVRYTATDDVINLWIDGKRIQLTREGNGQEFTDVKALLAKGDERAIVARLDRGGWSVPIYSQGMFKVNDAGTELVDAETGTKVRGGLAKLLIDWAKKGIPFEPLLKFHRRAQANPVEASREELFEYMRENHMSITQDGRFLAYKKVARNGKQLVDVYTKKIANDVGTRVEVPREKVDPDRRNECSYGLHVAAWGYMGTYSGDVILEVEVDPADVVAVPKDYNKQKMRVCGYWVLRETKARRSDTLVITTEDASTGARSLEKKVPNFDLMKAREVIEYVQSRWKVTITTDLKNKRAIVKRAYAIATGSAPVDDANDPLSSVGGGEDDSDNDSGYRHDDGDPFGHYDED